MKFKKYLKNFNSEQIQELNKQGLNVKEISKIIDIPEKRLAEMIKYFSIPIKKGFTKLVNDDFFDIIDTEEKAYLLGFFIADGYLQKEPKYKNGEIYSYSYRLGINNSIDDIEVIELFGKYICPNTELKIVNKSSNTVKRKDQILLRWNSKHMYDTLNSYNIHVRKTYDSEFYLPTNIIPQYLMRHFIRGLFDGDGHKFQCEIEICLNSKYFANQLIEFFINNNLNNYRITETVGKTCTYYKLYITGGAKAMNIIKDLFYKDSKFYLNRKYILFNTEVTN